MPVVTRLPSSGGAGTVAVLLVITSHPHGTSADEPSPPTAHSNGAHTLQVRVTGERNSTSEAAFVSVDRAEVRTG